MKVTLIVNKIPKEITIDGKFTWEKFNEIFQQVTEHQEELQGRPGGGERENSDRGREGWVGKVNPFYRKDVVDWPQKRIAWENGDMSKEIKIPRDANVDTTIEFDDAVPVGESWWTYHWKGIL